jgi:hypothetical protein
MRMRSSLISSAVSLAGLTCLSMAAGCDDLGKCDEAAARTPVLVGSTVMYAGQAIMVQTCATGCHASGATGAARVGAPKGLDFDVRPAAATGGLSATGAANVDAAGLATLRARQRKVYDQRYEIWEQVESDYMPPEGTGKAFRELSPGTSLTVNEDGTGVCTRGEGLASISSGSSQKILKNWLACKAPVIETQSSELRARTAGTVGDQWPQLSCSPGGGTGGDGGTDAGTDGSAGGDASTAPTFSDVFAVLASNCNACHSIDGAPGQKGFVLAPLATAYTTLLGADGTGGKVASGCASTTKPYVTPGKPEESYLLDKIKLTSGAICGNPMAFAPGLGVSAPADAELIRAWIAAGAVGP